ncbi:hypothetical protein B0J11DRAFT_274685 [Dendryphion nanum]|uniref:Uncharacterized protein n=1 Tax=Dendryphion nanum TaxID=256645 RepID=A0A9P9IPT7_9PLEO|nr:hypothetical protein B0J11DRAFT_274685 [Dendryphion nanum]
MADNHYFHKYHYNGDLYESLPTVRPIYSTPNVPTYIEALKIHIEDLTTLIGVNESPISTIHTSRISLPKNEPPVLASYSTVTLTALSETAILVTKALQVTILPSPDVHAERRSSTNAASEPQATPSHIPIDPTNVIEKNKAMRKTIIAGFISGASVVALISLFSLWHWFKKRKGIKDIASHMKALNVHSSLNSLPQSSAPKSEQSIVIEVNGNNTVEAIRQYNWTPELIRSAFGSDIEAASNSEQIQPSKVKSTRGNEQELSKCSGPICSRNGRKRRNCFNPDLYSRRTGD